MTTSLHNTKIVDAAELADVLNVTPGTVRKWAHGGVIPCLQITPKVMRFELNRVIDSLRRKSSMQDTHTVVGAQT
jgi:hypothetical protein